MNPLPRHFLRKLYADYGPNLLNEPERVDAFLADLCGEYHRERYLIVQAMRERIPAELLAQSQGRTIHGRWLSQRLESRYCLSAEAARWAIDSWSAVMDIAPFARNGPHDGYHELDYSRKALSNSPQRVLCQLIADHGPALLIDPARVNAFLADLCGPYARERYLLVHALHARVPVELLLVCASQKKYSHERIHTATHLSTVHGRWLLQRFQRRFGFSTEAARWAINSCALALNINPPEQDMTPMDSHVIPEEEIMLRILKHDARTETWLTAAVWARQKSEERGAAEVLFRQKAKERKAAEAVVKRKAEETDAAKAIAQQKAEERNAAETAVQQKAEERNAAESVAQQKAEEQDAAREAARQKSREMVTTEAAVREKAKEQGAARIAARQIAEELMEAEDAVRQRERVQKPDRAVAYTKVREWVTAKAAAHRKAQEWVAAEAVAYQKAEEWVAAKAADRQKAEEWLSVAAPARQKAEEQVTAKRAARIKALELATAKETVRQKTEELTAAEDTVRQKTEELTVAKDTVRQKTQELTTAKESMRQKTREQNDADVLVQQKELARDAAEENARQKAKEQAAAELAANVKDRLRLQIILLLQARFEKLAADMLVQQKELARDAAEENARQKAKEQAAAELAANVKDRLRLQIILLLQARFEKLALPQAEGQDAAEETIIRKAEISDENLRDEPDVAEEASIHETRIPEDNIPDDRTLPSPSPDTPVEKQTTARASGCWKLLLLLLLLGLPGICILFSSLGTMN